GRFGTARHLDQGNREFVSHFVSNPNDLSNPCHPERSEGPAFGGELQIPRRAGDDNSLKGVIHATTSVTSNQRSSIPKCPVCT
ncbi:MAG: hypothetical protein ACLP56_13725, partial [Candidatus Sulfotelmatobacter sp.]